MSYTPVDVPAFGGLDFSDEEDAQGAIDLLNCYVKQQGKLEVRPGYAQIGGATSGVGATGSVAYNAFSSYTNLIAYPDFESGTTGWSGSTSVTLSSQGTTGSKYLRATVSDGVHYSPFTIYPSSNVAVSGSTTYRFDFSYLANSSIGTVGVTFLVSWYDSGSTLISTSSESRPSGYGVASANFTSPSTAAYARPTIKVLYSGKDSQYIELDSVLFVPATYTGSFFTGTVTSASSNVVLGYTGATDTIRLLKNDGTNAYSAITSVTGATAGNVFTKTSHGMPNGTQVTLSSLSGGSGLSTSTTYYVISRTDNTFQLATTAGGSAVSLGSTVTSVTVNPSGITNITTGNPWSFASVSGKAYGSNGKNALFEAGVGIVSQPTVSTKAAAATSYTAGLTAPKPLYVGLQTPDNRLIAAGYTGTADGPNGTATTPATVFFSQPDNPLKWDETDYVVVGDAQDPITGVTNWGDMVVVFKQNDWFIFYGNSTDADGGSVFNYRRIEPGCEMVSYAVGANGVYVTDTENNIHLFTGGVPQLVFRGSNRYQAQPGQGFNAHPLVGLPAIAQGKSGYIIIDDRLRQVYFFAFAQGLTAGTNAGQSVYFPYTTGLAKFPSGTTDAGTTITANYTSSSSAFGQAGVEKTIRQTEIHGTGTVDLSWGVNNQNQGSASTVEMRNGRGLDRTAVRGETLSWRVEGSDWMIRRIVPYLREVRVAGVQT